MMRSDAGYTLLEMLAAIAIIALMSVPMASGMEFGIRTWQDAHVKVSEQERIMLVRARLTDWMRGAHPVDVNRVAGVKSYPVTGDEATLSFMTAIHPDPVRDSLYRVTLRLSEGGALQAGVMPDHAQYEDGAEETWFDLLAGVDAVRFSYLDGVDAGGSFIWASEWQERISMPQAFRMDLDFADDKQGWQTVTVRPVISEQAHCVPLPGRIPVECMTGAGAG